MMEIAESCLGGWMDELEKVIGGTLNNLNGTDRLSTELVQ